MPRLAAGCLLLSACCLPAAAAESDAAAADPDIGPQVEKSIEKGCAFLARNQNRDGSLRSMYPCAATALAGLAWLAAGSTPQEGPYARNISAALDYILRCSSRGGFIAENTSFGASGMYGHGYSTQFLAQVYGMVADETAAARVKDVLTRAVRSIETCQNQYGGWNSSPNGELTDDGSGAIAVMQITALRAAQSCGVQVRGQVIEKAKKYLLAMTNDQGWYAYNWHARGNGGSNSIATTGAGMYMLGALNLQDDPKYTKGIQNVMRVLPGRGNESAFGGWYNYAIFYASLAIFQHGGNEWARWYPALSQALISTQASDGSWPDSYGGVFVALSVLSLELPYRCLPMFQEGGAGR